MERPAAVKIAAGRFLHRTGRLRIGHGPLSYNIKTAVGCRLKKFPFSVQGRTYYAAANKNARKKFYALQQDFFRRSARVKQTVPPQKIFFPEDRYFSVFKAFRADHFSVLDLMFAVSVS